MFLVVGKPQIKISKTSILFVVAYCEVIMHIARNFEICHESIIAIFIEINMHNSANATTAEGQTVELTLFFVRSAKT